MSIERIACCTDFSTNADEAFTTAMDLAAKYHARLFVVHVLPSEINPTLTDMASVSLDETHKALIPELQERMQAEYGQRLEGHVEYEIIVLYGHVSSEILTFLEQEKMGLVVMGSYGLAGIELVFFGSVAKRGGAQGTLLGTDRALKYYRILAGPPREAIPTIARVEKCDLIVIGPRGLGNVKGIIWGSVTHRMLPGAPCPILVVQ